MLRTGDVDEKLLDDELVPLASIEALVDLPLAEEEEGLIPMLFCRAAEALLCGLV